MYYLFPGENSTATELADALDKMERTSPPRTVVLSNLSEAIAYWTLRNPELIPAHQAFATARASYWSYNDTHEAWADLKAAGAALAPLMRAIGSIHLDQCEDGFIQGRNCSGVLRPDGSCCYLDRHDPEGANYPDDADDEG